MPTRPRSPLRAINFLVALILCGSSANAQHIHVSSKVVGKTPRIVGLNCGNYQPDSNTATWWKWLGVNGVRIFTSADRVEPKDDIAPHGDGVSDPDSFVARRKALRADPENPEFINFDAFENGYKKSGTINYALAYGELSAMGIEPLAMSARSNERHPINDWADRWEHWQHYYAQAYYLGKNYGVSRYSMYNEPDHKDKNITQADYLLRLQLASDAIQSAIQDVNRDSKRKLKCQIIGPITAGSDNDYGPRLKNSDTRDDRIGWGQLVIRNLHTDFLGRQPRGFQLIHTYAYQQYNGDAVEFGTDLANIKRLVAADLSQLRRRSQIDFGLTEFNVHSNGEFEKRSDNLDTPSRYAGLGGILAGLASQQPQELYLFKFSSNANDKFLQKNAILHNSRFDAPYNIGGATRAAGVFKLFAKAFTGSLDLHAIPSYKQGDGLYVITTYDRKSRRCYLFSANVSGKDRELNVDLSAWGIQNGAMIQVEEVSQGHLVEVTQRIAETGTVVRIPQPAESAVLLSVSRVAPKQKLAIAASADASVTAGSKAGDGSGEFLTVKNSARKADNRSAAFIKFQTPKVKAKSIDRAVLQLHGVQRGRDEFATAHVYGLSNDNWKESDISWAGSGNLSESSGEIKKISDNFVSGFNESAEFVGHLTVNKKGGTVGLDVTDFLRQQEDQQVTFLIVREVRIDGERIDDSGSHLRFASKESGELGPKLLLDLR